MPIELSRQIALLPLQAVAKIRALGKLGAFGAATKSATETQASVTHSGATPPETPRFVSHGGCCCRVPEPSVSSRMFSACAFNVVVRHRPDGTPRKDAVDDDAEAAWEEHFDEVRASAVRNSCASHGNGIRGVRVPGQNTAQTLTVEMKSSFGRWIDSILTRSPPLFYGVMQDGYAYYWNRISGESSWNKPVAAVKARLAAMRAFGRGTNSDVGRDVEGIAAATLPGVSTVD